MANNHPSRINKIFVGLENACFYSAILAVTGIMVLITCDSFGRYILNSPIVGLTEFVEEYLMAATVFLGMSYTYKEGGHVRVEVFLRFIPKALHDMAKRILSIIIALLFGLIANQAWSLTERALKYDQVSAGAWAYPLAPAYFLVVLGSGLMCARLVYESLSLSSN